MNAPRTHVIGAGLAGLSTAVRVAKAGISVALYEAGTRAGGRCRSYYDAQLGRRIDNGNHLLVSGNLSALAYLDLVGAGDALTGPAQPRFPFVDLATGAHWTVAPSAGRLPFWILDPARRVPGTRALDYLGALRLAVAGANQTVAQTLGGASELYRKFWAPLAVAILNTAVEEAAARPLWTVLMETFAKGGAFCRPLVARDGLSEAFVDPALAWLARRGVIPVYGARLRALKLEGKAVTGLDFGVDTVALAPGDAVVLALPPGAAAEMIPELVVPDSFRGIVNAHFLVRDNVPEPQILGVLGGMAEWIFRRGDLASVTISAANAELLDRPAASLATYLWRDVAKAFGYPMLPLPLYRVVKEKRATFAQTPAQLRLRPQAATGFANLFLAGDWTATGLPATIEGAIRSGESAAKLAVRQVQA